jgi:hypothetical protein
MEEIILVITNFCSSGHDVGLYGCITKCCYLIEHKDFRLSSRFDATLHWFLLD